MTLKQDVVALLRSTVVGKIKFRYGSADITGSKFKRLASDIISGKVGVVAGHVSANAGAEYHYHQSHSHENSLILPRSWSSLGNDTWRRMSVIHEATHALQDKAAKHMNEVAAEAPAFVAEAVYTKLAGRKHSIFQTIHKSATYDETRVVYRRAWLAAEELLGSSKRISVPPWRVKHINNAVHAHSLYNRLQKYEFDGFK